LNQDDIFKLLLVVLLITNERGNNDRHHNGQGTLFSSLNEIIILALLLNAFSCGPRRNDCNDDCGDSGNGRRRAAQDGCCDRVF